MLANIEVKIYEFEFKYSQIWRTLLLLLLAPVTRRGGARLRRRRPLVPVLRMVLGRDGQFVKVLESRQDVSAPGSPVPGVPPP